MADKIENHTLHLLREIREEVGKLNAKIDVFAEQQRAANAKLETKVDKLGIELIGVRGRVRKVEETLESMARIRSDGVLTGQ